MEVTYDSDNFSEHSIKSPAITSPLHVANGNSVCEIVGNIDEQAILHGNAINTPTVSNSRDIRLTLTHTSSLSVL